MVRTTKQIFEMCIPHGRKINEQLELNNQEWVCLVSLKKEIEIIKLHLASEYKLGSKEHKLCCYALNVFKKHIDLCKSPEQSTQAEMQSSVFGEQTGEDDATTSKSSPVQNPDERYSDSLSRVKASGQESLKNSPANIQKKCTCGVYPGKVINGVCTHCGGAL